MRRGEVTLRNIGAKSGLDHLLQLWACHCPSLTSVVPSLKWDYGNTPTAVQRGVTAVISDQSDPGKVQSSGSMGHSSLGFGGRCCSTGTTGDVHASATSREECMCVLGEEWLSLEYG